MACMGGIYTRRETYAVWHGFPAGMMTVFLVRGRQEETVVLSLWPYVR